VPVQPNQLASPPSPTAAATALRNFPLSAGGATVKGRWTLEEEEALIEGVRLHGRGKWIEIMSDTSLWGGQKCQRSQWSVKDKWRNLLNMKRVRDEDE
jgi:hypothetical protein